MGLMPRIYDISPLITESLSVWPGDTPPRREILLDMARGDSVTLSTLHATVHLGAHADAPSHYRLFCSQHRASDRSNYTSAPARSWPSAVPRGALIRTRRPAGADPRRAVLLATGTFPDPTRFNDDFAALEPALVEHLHERGVRLVGVDTPSVDPFDSKELPAHQTFFKHDLAILEGLVLDGVPEGSTS